MIDILDDGARYARVLEVVRKVLKIYNYKEIRALNYNASNIYKVYYLDTNKLVLRYDNTDTLKSLSAITASVSILKGLGISSYVVYCKHDNDVKKALTSSSIINELKESLNDYEIVSFDTVLASFKDNMVVLDLDKLLELNLNHGKRLVSNLVLHAYFEGEDDDCNLEIAKIINVCRIGGLISEASYESDEEVRSLFYCYLSKESLKSFKINILDTTKDEEELVSIYDVYPYILNKLNKNSACSSCKEGK